MGATGYAKEIGLAYDQLLESWEWEETWFQRDS